ncbi:MAG: CPBP family intramembrane metalloprotease [Chthoniobacterales bacterium]|nr:CPBP family intramembrane metalloprotease [Chthoniobacterales bacterium]
MSNPAARPDDDRLARHLRGFGLIGLLAIVVVLSGNYLWIPLSSLLVLLWAWRSRTPWREIGFVRPQSWLTTLLLGVLLGCVFKLVMKALVMPLLGAPPTNAAFQFLVGNTAALPHILYVVIVIAGFGEEILFRGYAFERLGKLFGHSTWAKTLIVVLTSAWFGWEHYPLQGLPGVQQAAIVGLAFGAIYAATGNLWTLIIAHIAFDLTAVAIIYFNIEAQIAHLIFR